MNNDPTNKSGYKDFAFGSADLIEDPHDTYNDLYNLIDGMEPEKRRAYREAAQMYSRQLRMLMAFILRRIDKFNLKSKIILLAVAIVTGCEDLIQGELEGMSQRQIAQKLGINHGTISRHVVMLKNELQINMDIDEDTP